MIISLSWTKKEGTLYYDPATDCVKILPYSASHGERVFRFFFFCFLMLYVFFLAVFASEDLTDRASFLMWFVLDLPFVLLSCFTVVFYHKRRDKTFRKEKRGKKIYLPDADEQELRSIHVSVFMAKGVERGISFRRVSDAILVAALSPLIVAVLGKAGSRAAICGAVLFSETWLIMSWFRDRWKRKKLKKRLKQMTKEIKPLND